MYIISVRTGLQNNKKEWSMSMGNNVIIEMKSIQSVNDDVTESELITEGEFSGDGEDYSIAYEESEATGFEGSKTLLTVNGQRMASIFRKGAANSNLVVEMGKKHHCHYSTPYGEMVVGIYAHKIQNTLNEAGGSLYMKYTVDIDSAYLSDNEIYLKVKKM